MTYSLYLYLRQGYEDRTLGELLMDIVQLDPLFQEFFQHSQFPNTTQYMRLKLSGCRHIDDVVRVLNELVNDLKVLRQADPYKLAKRILKVNPHFPVMERRSRGFRNVSSSAPTVRRTDSKEPLNISDMSSLNETEMIPSVSSSVHRAAKVIPACKRDRGRIRKVHRLARYVFIRTSFSVVFHT